MGSLNDFFLKHPIFPFLSLPGPWDRRKWEQKWVYRRRFCVAFSTRRAARGAPTRFRSRRKSATEWRNPKETPTPTKWRGTNRRPKRKYWRQAKRRRMRTSSISPGEKRPTNSLRSETCLDETWRFFLFFFLFCFGFLVRFVMASGCFAGSALSVRIWKVRWLVSIRKERAQKAAFKKCCLVFTWFWVVGLCRLES